MENQLSTTILEYGLEKSLYLVVDTYLFAEKVT